MAAFKTRSEHMNFQGVVLNIADLDRSIDFYRDVYGFTLLARKDQLASMYAPGNDRPQVILLRSVGTTSARRVMGAGHVGLRAVVLEVPTVDELERIGTALDKQGSLVARHGDDATWAAVFGRDPDHIAVIAGTSLIEGPITLDAWAELDDALYSAGE
jgi:catechol 2,3-dioxygenase-like lactoylglutathione lyase family enzyme